MKDNDKYPKIFKTNHYEKDMSGARISDKITSSYATVINNENAERTFFESFDGLGFQEVIEVPFITSKVCSVTHPKTKQLSVDIMKVNGTEIFFYDEDGDWYDESWTSIPLDDCKLHAMEMLNSKYNGSYYSNPESDEERRVFSAMQEGR